MIRLRPGVAVAIFFALVAVVFGSVFPYIGTVNNPNENVRTYTTMALVEDHTFRIDKEVREYGHVNDMARVPQPDGSSHFFQMKGPANAYSGIPVYWAMLKLAPLLHLSVPGEAASPQERAAWLESVTFVLRFFTVQIPCFLFLVWFERWLRGTTADVVLRLSAVLGAGLGTNYLAYSLMFVSHALFAVASFVAFGVTLDQWMDHPLAARRSARAAFVVGFCAGWAVLLDYQGLPVSFVIVVFAACIFWRPKAFLAMIGGGAIHVAAMMFFQWRAFGNPLTPGHKFSDTPAFAIEHSRGLYGIDKPDFHVLAQLCFSRAYGFFGTSPFAWLGLLAIPFVLFVGFGPPAVQARRRVATLVWMLAMAILFVSVTGKSNWHGGWTIGPRYYGAAPPFFAFGAVAALEWFAQKDHALRSAVRAVAVGLALASVAQTGLVSMVYNTLPENISRPFVQAALPLTITGYVPHHLFELFGWKSATPFHLVVACFVVAALLPLLLRANESLAAWGLRLVAALGIAAFALGPAFSLPSPEERDSGTGTVAWLTVIWEPQGRDTIASARQEAERFGSRRPCAWAHVARMERLVGLNADAARDEARAGAAMTECGGAGDRVEEMLVRRIAKMAAHAPPGP
jgi:hypothetical protein